MSCVKVFAVFFKAFFSLAIFLFLHSLGRDDADCLTKLLEFSYFSYAKLLLTNRVFLVFSALQCCGM